MYNTKLNLLKCIINIDINRIKKTENRTLKQLCFKKREHLQKWIANNLLCLNKDFLIIQKEFAGDYEKTRKDLLEYCKLDTYAMVKIYEVLIKVSKV